MTTTEAVLAVITVMGGLAFFLYGMNCMSSGLEKMAGGSLEQTLKKLTSNRLRSMALGAGITIAIQSSSAVTVMLVGLVNCGIMEVEQTVSVIIGAETGKTFTTWLLAMTSLEGNLAISLLNPKYFSLILALIGAIFILSAKSDRKQDIGRILVGFAVLIYGMKMMSDAVEPLKESEEFCNLLIAFKNPLLGVLVGTVVTGVIQSSAASIGILQTLALTTGAITFDMAIPIIMGQNIGTCVTAIIASFGVNRNAKKVAVVHISFALIGTIVCLTLYELLDSIFVFPFSEQTITPVGIAIVHTLFNLCTTLIVSPFANHLVKLANLIIRDKEDGEDEKEKNTELIDKQLLASPSVSVSICNDAAKKMAILARDTLLLTMDLFGEYEEKKFKRIIKNEGKLDDYEDRLGTALVNLNARPLSAKDSMVTSRILRAIGDLERLGDHSANLAYLAKQIHKEKLQFSEDAQRELDVLLPAIAEIVESMAKAITSGTEEDAFNIEPLEQVIDCIITDVKANHVDRLQKGKCTIEMGILLTDLLTNYERISDHCSNIGIAVIETSHATFAPHKYLSTVKFSNKHFNDCFEDYQKKYKLS